MSVSPRRPKKLSQPPTAPRRFLFPQSQTRSKELPDPSKFFSPNLSAPFPTNSFFQNFVIDEGDQPEYIHPYLIKSSGSSLSVCYPRLLAESTEIKQKFEADLTISSLNNNTTNSNSTHKVSSFSDLSVTLDLPSSNLRFYLVRGSPFVTCDFIGGPVKLSISTAPKILHFYEESDTKYTFQLENNQKWVLYSFKAINLRHDDHGITSDEYSGIIRIALFTKFSPLINKSILDQFHSCYPVSGEARITKRFQVEYKWEKIGSEDLLMLAHPLHLRLLSTNDCTIKVLKDFNYESIDGELRGVIGDSWVLKTDELPISFTKGIKRESYDVIQNALKEDVKAICREKESPKSPYLYGVLMARIARLASIAQEVDYDEIPLVEQILKDKIEPWLDGTSGRNRFLYNGKWGGIVIQEESIDSESRFSSGLYHDHHFYVGYFLYVIAILAKMDPAWGRQYRPQAYSLVADFMNSGKGADSNYPYLRCFDLWKLHSWLGGPNKKSHVIYQDSTSEAINAYYAAALMGQAYKDDNLVNNGLTLLALEIYSAKNWWHVRKGKNPYEETCALSSRMVSILSSNRRDCARANEIKFHVLPLLPITEYLYSDVEYVRELVKWMTTDPSQEPHKDEFEEVVCTLEAIYDKKFALKKLEQLKKFNYGNSCTNLLWWIHSRRDNPSPYPSPPPPLAQFSSPSILGCDVETSEYTYDELREAMRGSSKEWEFNGHNNIFKGTLADGKIVAVEMLYNTNDKDFWGQINILSRIKHECAVKFLGYCLFEDGRRFVHEFVPNGNLSCHLHGAYTPVMPWKKRVKVALDAARGIEYLHEDRRIIHTKIKSDIILLDNDFNAKISDFKFARLVNTDEEELTEIPQPFGYSRSEDVMHYTKKSDVYSFGVVLMELISGRGRFNLSIWALPLIHKPLSNENFQELVDSKLNNDFNESEMNEMLRIAAHCLEEFARDRPIISRVVSDLEKLWDEVSRRE